MTLTDVYDDALRWCTFLTVCIAYQCIGICRVASNSIDGVRFVSNAPEYLHRSRIQSFCNCDAECVIRDEVELGGCREEEIKQQWHCRAEDNFLEAARL